MKQWTMAELVVWIMRARRGKAFQNFTYQDILWTCQRSIQENGFGFIVGENGICGVAIGRPKEGRMFHVEHILTTHPLALKALVQQFRARFPGWTITGNRRKGRVRYRTERLCKLLER